MSSTWCPNCYQNSCPEAPDITINEYTVAVDGSTVQWYHEYFTGADVDPVLNTLTLAHTPISTENVQLILNSGVQGEDAAGAQANFSVAGDVLTLLWVPAATDLLHVFYQGVV